MRGSETWAKSTSYLFSLWWDWVWTFNDPIRKSQTYWISHVTQNSNSYFDCAFFQITNLDHYSSVSKNGIKTQWTTFDEISRQVLNWTERLSHHCFRFSQAIAFFKMKKNKTLWPPFLMTTEIIWITYFFKQPFFMSVLMQFEIVWNVPFGLFMNLNWLRFVFVEKNQMAVPPTKCFNCLISSSSSQEFQALSNVNSSTCSLLIFKPKLHMALWAFL